MNALQKLFGFLTIALLLVVAAPGEAAEAAGAADNGAQQGNAVIVTINALPSGFMGLAPPIDVQLWQVGGRQRIVQGLRFGEAEAVEVNAAYSRAFVTAGAHRLQPAGPQRLQQGKLYCLVVAGHKPKLVQAGQVMGSLQQMERDFRCWRLLHKFKIYGAG